MAMYLPDITHILPEIFLIITAFLILIDCAVRKNAEPDHLKRFGHIGFASLLVAFVILTLIHHPEDRVVLFEGQLIQDDFVYLAKSIILLGSAAVFGLSLLVMIKEHLLSFEYFTLVLFATVGMMLMVSANDFLSLFLSLEVQGLSLYILAALDRDQAITSEAALKYFVLGALATCLYLYGVSLLYGFSGTTNFDTLASIIQEGATSSLPLGLVVGLVFIIASLAFKVSVVPFHMWTPDVYQGCPTPITAFIAATPKVAAMLVLLRILIGSFISLHDVWQPLIATLSCLSMIVGAFGALTQSNLKRLLAYSAIGQMGYTLMGVAAANNDGIQSVFVYLILYLVMIIGTFGCLLCLRGKGTYNVETIEDLSGLAALHPRISFCLSLFMFSLAGIPPLAGFFAKLYVFKAALSAGLIELVIIGAVVSVISAYYYLKIVKVMYFDNIPELPSFSYGQTIVLSVPMAIILKFCALVTLLFFVYPSPLLDLIHKTAFVTPN